jgi:hypothetical protein
VIHTVISFVDAHSWIAPTIFSALAWLCTVWSDVRTHMRFTRLRAEMHRPAAKTDRSNPTDTVR